MPLKWSDCVRWWVDGQATSWFPPGTILSPVFIIIIINTCAVAVHFDSAHMYIKMHVIWIYQVTAYHNSPLIRAPTTDHMGWMV